MGRRPAGCSTAASLASSVEAGQRGDTSAPPAAPPCRMRQPLGLLGRGESTGTGSRGEMRSDSRKRGSSPSRVRSDWRGVAGAERIRGL
eukprot:6582613-Prymnesium_polylepis.1